MAQRYLPLRPPPETWGTPPSPIPPLGTKGRAAALPFGNPARGSDEGYGERSRAGCGADSARCAALIELQISGGKKRIPCAPFFAAAQAHFQNRAAPRFGCADHFAGQRIPDIFLFHRARRIFFLMLQKENRGAFKWARHILGVLSKLYNGRLNPRPDSTALG